MEQENLFLLHALRMGIFISFLYDILRVYRRLFPHGLFWVSVEDLVFWIYCSAEVFFLMHREGDGNLRWFAVLGAMLGMGFYVKLVSPLFVKYSLMILGPVVRFFRKLCGTVYRNVHCFVKKKLTSIFRMIKMKVHKCSVRKWGVRNGCGKNGQEKTGLGRRFRKASKRQDDIS